MAEKKAWRELPIGTKGLAFEDISKNKAGEAYFTIGGKIEKVDIYALEDIRKNREIQVVALDNRCVEATPTELKYETVKELWQRVGENYPLPVSMGRKGVTWTDSKLITASGATELIAAPGTAKRIRVHGICLSNKHTVSVDVALSEKTDGTKLKFRHVLAADGGNVDLNLTDMCWDLSENTALQYYPQAAYATGVLVSMGYSIEDVS